MCVSNMWILKKTHTQTPWGSYSHHCAMKLLLDRIFFYFKPVFLWIDLHRDSNEHLKLLIQKNCYICSGFTTVDLHGFSLYLEVTWHDALRDVNNKFIWNECTLKNHRETIISMRSTRSWAEGGKSWIILNCCAIIVLFHTHLCL